MTHAAGSGVPRLIAWEITRSCGQSCRHCRASAQNAPYQGELTTDEIFRTLDSIAAFSSPIIILTGGDPLLRDDVYEIASYGTGKGLRMVMALCGQTVDESVFDKLKESGVQRVSFSIDGSNAVTHDEFRGTPGSFMSIMRAMELARNAGMPFQINTTVSRLNIKELPDILDLAVKQNAVSFHPFLLVPTGKAKTMIDLELTPDEYEETLNWIYERKQSLPIEFKPTCAPHYYRIFRQRELATGRAVKPETHGMDAMSKGCMGGQSFAFISHTGKLQICGFLDVECGDLRESGYDFQTLWNGSAVFKQMRDLSGYHGKCGVCGFRTCCGGCRARAYGITGDYLAEEPYCSYVPPSLGKE